MINKGRLCLCLLMTALYTVLLLPHESGARPASRVLHELKQPDGPSFMARQWGDEFDHGWETEEGYSVVFDDESGNWRYAVDGGAGRLVSSSGVVGRDSPPAGIGRHVRAGKTVPEKVKRTGYRRMKGLGQFSEVTGAGKLPVVLINFSDTVTQYEKADFEKMLFGGNNRSMNDYYREVSYGKYGISGEVAGWVTAPKGHDYYGQDDPVYPGNTDINVTELVYEAAKAADAALDYSLYDLDGDCEVDALAVVHQGTDQAVSGVKTDIWSHQFNIGYDDAFDGGYITDDACKADPALRVRVDKYFIQNETASENGVEHMSTIGVFCHEFGHVLGLPDFYDTDNSSAGTGMWDVMAGGLNRVYVEEDTPAHFNPWAKYKLGWVTPVNVTQTVTNQAIQQASVAADVYKLGSGDPVSGEYFLVENRQKTGFDEGLPAAGLLIWHVDAGAMEAKLSVDDWNSVNSSECYPPYGCSGGHYGVALVQADNKWGLEKNRDGGDPGDPFPGTKNRRSFGAYTTPGSNFYNGSLSSVRVWDISDPATAMTASLSAVPQYVLTVNKTGTGMVEAAGLVCGAKGCSGIFDGGATVALTAVPGKGFALKEWTGCPTAAGNTCTLTVGAFTTVTAVFAKTLTLTVKISGNGKVTSSPGGIDCGGSCKAQYLNATTVTLTAIPDGGQAFFKWSGCTSSSGNSCTVKVDRARTVTAKFRAQ